ncbi:DUF4055 domain-containing protein [uncultured Brevundimonas sp.]|uniref:DUF4055 domain-containing protein n=1 Tax=uncultured Brevundimonas sp. TaxID=213418 RepID=UPI002636042B|nr:DUF4055 domain-containing protein [uncultured Brevundimonas sp.]
MSAPDTTSSAYDAMKPYWDTVAAIMGGTEAMRKGGETYLPRFDGESLERYEIRRKHAKFTNIFGDMIETLASKPFAEEITLKDGTSETIRALAENIDARGNRLDVFAKAVFSAGLAKGIDWVWVDYSRAQPRTDGKPLSVAEEKAQRLRPYWVRIPAERMLAVYTDTVDGEEQVVHARIREDGVRRDGYNEVAVERIRVLEREPLTDGDGKHIGYGPAIFRLMEKSAAGRARKATWTEIDSGPITIGVISLVPFITGERKDGGWEIIPPFKPVAELQVEHYQAEAKLKSISDLTGYPMLVGKGINPPIGADGKPIAAPVGPQAVLYAPPHGETGTSGDWSIIEPNGTSLTFLAKQVETIEGQMRELGRQPLIATTGITAVAAAYSSQKATSVIQAWALSLKDMLEQCLKFTAMWLSEAVEPELVWNLDDIDLTIGDENSINALTAMRAKGDISRKTYWAECKRRGVLGADFDADTEEVLLASEAPDEDTEDDLKAAAGAQ